MHRFALSSLLLLAACGISNGTLLADLDDDDAAKLCEEFVAEFPGRTVTCDFAGTEVEVEIGLFADAAECTQDFEPAPADCTATVGDMRDCLGEVSSITDEEVCDPEADAEIPASCQAIFDCYEDEPEPVG